MTFLTGLALRRSSVTILIIILVLAAGVFVYNRIERELFPALEFPNITISTYYPNADPETVAREVTEPIEDAIANLSGLRETQSTSGENVSIILATFNFGEDMTLAESDIESEINGLNLPDGVEYTSVSRINNNTFPVMQMSVVGDRDIVSLQRILDKSVVPELKGVQGVYQVYVLGQVEERVNVTVDTDKLDDLGFSMAQVSAAVSGSNIGFPVGNITQNQVTLPVRVDNQLRSLDELRSLVIGYESVALPSDAPPGFSPAGLRGQRPVLLSDVATVELGTASASRISRANGKPGLSLWIIKDPDANTVDVTDAVEEVFDTLDVPPDVQFLELANDGPIVEESLSDLLREGFLGFIFAITTVFVFLINTRPTLLRGLVLTLRPTIVIGISIPLSVLSGIILMSFTDISLNFMSLAGLAIAVGRVVDDSIVVLESIYRHIQQGEDRMTAAITSIQEVGAAIVSSTLTTVVVFIPLSFIQGLVGEFFTPFALSVSFALIASTFVALTAVPVLGATLLRRGDFPDEAQDPAGAGRDTLLQRIYTPMLTWSIRHKFLALLTAITVTAASFSLLLVVPITFFPTGTPDYLVLDIELEPGTAISRTYAEALRTEEVLESFVEEGTITLYQVNVGQSGSEFDFGVSGGNLHLAGFTIRVAEDAPRDIARQVRERLPEPGPDVTYNLDEISAGPPSDALEITVAGPDFTDIAQVAAKLEQALAQNEHITNLKSNVSAARDEVSIKVNPAEAAEYGLTAPAVAQQVNQFILGRAVTEVDLEEQRLDVVIRGQPEQVADVDRLKNLLIQGPMGAVKLGSIADLSIIQGPLAISRFDGERSASITGTITAVDTQAVGAEVQAAIDALELPPGVQIITGGIFQQVEEGFQDVFTAMAVGIILVYLVMVASLGSLRNPFIIVLSLPLAVVGALVALWLTGRTLSLSAMMGFLLLIGIVVTNAIVLITYVEQLRERGMGVHEALIQGGRIRIRPILMTAFTTTFALLPLALTTNTRGGIIGAELATVVIGGLVSSTFLTLIVAPVIYVLMHWSIPRLPGTIRNFWRQRRPGPIRSIREEPNP